MDGATSNGFGLRPKLALLCVLLVFVAEVLVFIPSGASFRKGWLEERVDRAQTASLAVDASPRLMVSAQLGRVPLEHAGVLPVLF